MVGSLLNNLPEAAIYLLAAVSFGIIWTTRGGGLFHLAVGGVMVCAAGVFNRALSSGATLPSALLYSAASGACLGLLIEVAVYGPLRRREAPSEDFLLASFGVLIVLERAATIWLGTMPLSLQSHRSVAGRVEFFGSQLTLVQWLAVVFAVVTCAACAALYAAGGGRRLLAVRQSAFLYDWRVGRSSRFLAGVAASSGALAALGGALFHLQHPLQTQSAAMGYIVPAFVVVLGAEALDRKLGSLTPPHRRSAVVERVRLLPLYASAAVLLALIGQGVTQVLQPRWKDTALLVVALATITLGSSDRSRHDWEVGA